MIDDNDQLYVHRSKCYTCVHYMICNSLLIKIPMICLFALCLFMIFYDGDHDYILNCVDLADFLPLKLNESISSFFLKSNSTLQFFYKGKIFNKIEIYFHLSTVYNSKLKFQ